MSNDEICSATVVAASLAALRLGERNGHDERKSENRAQTARPIESEMQNVITNPACTSACAADSCPPTQKICFFPKGLTSS